MLGTSSLTHRVIKRADPKTVQNKILVGYQGWFTCAGDGPPVHVGHHGWLHWFNKPIPEGGQPNFDLFPDVSEYDDDELYTAPGLTLPPNNKPARLFSSRNPKTVKRHFNWMAKYGIDGVFLQRFASQCEVDGNTSGDTADIMRIRDEVLDRVREAAEAEGRVWAIMYDVSGVPAEKIEHILTRDWARLVNEKRVLDSPYYLHERGQPVIALWGFGFNEARHHPATVARIAQHFKHRTPGGAYLWAGIPAHWRTCTGDMDPNSAFIDVFTKEFDAISPWTVGRYTDTESADRFYETVIRGDLRELQSRGASVYYIPTIFPGESSHNLSGGARKANGCPRDGGKFFWRQFRNLKKEGARTVYVAMFDEYDEGTALLPALPLKRQLPTGGQFLALDADGFDNLVPDWYLKITGLAGEILKNERPIYENLPKKDLDDFWANRPKYEVVPINPLPAAASSSAAGQSSSAPVAGGSRSGGGSWQDIAEPSDDLPPPAYTLIEDEPVAPRPAPASTIPAVAPAPAPVPVATPSVAPVAAATPVHHVPDQHVPERASSVQAGFSNPQQAPASVSRSSTYSAASGASSNTPVPAAVTGATASASVPWQPPPTAPHFAPPSSAPPSSFPPSSGPPTRSSSTHPTSPPVASPHFTAQNLSRPQSSNSYVRPVSPNGQSHSPATRPVTTPPGPQSAYNSSVANLANDFSRLNTGSPHPASPPAQPGSAGYGFTRPSDYHPNHSATLPSGQTHGHGNATSSHTAYGAHHASFTPATDAHSSYYAGNASIPTSATSTSYNAGLSTGYHPPRTDSITSTSSNAPSHYGAGANMAGIGASTSTHHGAGVGQSGYSNYSAPSAPPPSSTGSNPHSASSYDSAGLQPSFPNPASFLPGHQSQSPSQANITPSTSAHHWQAPGSPPASNNNFPGQYSNTNTGWSAASHLDSAYPGQYGGPSAPPTHPSTTSWAPPPREEKTFLGGVLKSTTGVADKYLGEERRKQLEKGVGNVAQTGVKWLGKLAK